MNSKTTKLQCNAWSLFTDMFVIQYKNFHSILTFVNIIALVFKETTLTICLKYKFFYWLFTQNNQSSLVIYNFLFLFLATSFILNGVVCWCLVKGRIGWHASPTCWLKTSWEGPSWRSKSEMTLPLWWKISWGNSTHGAALGSHWGRTEMCIMCIICNSNCRFVEFFCCLTWHSKWIS